MELRQLEYLVAVADEANFTRAGERVHVSQSGVSAQIRALERELGATLLDRSSRVVVPTQAGRAALEHARIALAAAGRLRDAVDDVNAVVRGHVRVGTVTACKLPGFYEGLDVFHHLYPGVGMSLVEAPSDELVARVRRGELDVALAGVPDGFDARGLQSHVVLRERLVAGVVPRDPLAGGAITLAELAERSLVTLPAGAGVRAVLDGEFARVGTAGSVAFEAGAPDTVVELAARGLGVAVVSESMLDTSPSRQLEPVRIVDAETEALLVLVWRPGAPAVRHMVGQLATGLIPVETS